MSREKPMVVRLKVGKETFEALCHPHKVTEYRAGKAAIGDVLVDDESVWKNHSRGERWGAKELEAHFQKINVLEILTQIVDKGKAQVSLDETRSCLLFFAAPPARRTNSRRHVACRKMRRLIKSSGKWSTTFTKTTL